MLLFFAPISTRTEKIGSVIRRALAPHLIRFEPEHGLITITAIEVFPDLSAAKVFVDAEKRGHKLETQLQKVAKALQKEIAPHLTQRRMPKLIFVLDMGAAASKRIDELLNQ